MGTPNNTPKKKNGEAVVLLHGILRSNFNMTPMSLYLKREGYETININYPSREHDLENLTKFLNDKLSMSKTFNNASKVHFVTHSMGGLLTRYYLTKHKPNNLGRVVMMGPPNNGSEFADFMMEYKPLKTAFEKVFGPAGTQLTTSHVHNTNDIKYELGVIAGRRSVNPIAPWVLDGEHDGIVPVERTKIKGMKDHIVLPTTHSFMMVSPSVMKQTAYFLKKGKFDRQP